MPEVGVEEAALRLGVSVDTIRRRFRKNTLPGRHSDDGRLMITLPDAAPAASAPPSSAGDTAEQPPMHTYAPPPGTLPESDHLRQLLAEKDARIVSQEQAIETLRNQLENAERRLDAQQKEHVTAESELRQLLLQAQLQLQAVLPKLMPPGEPQQPHRPWWRWW